MYTWTNSVLLSDLLRTRVQNFNVGCETWSLILKAAHMLRVFENRVLRLIFGSKRDEVNGEWR